MLWLFYCLPLLVRLDRGVVHVVVVILSTIIIYDLTEELFMLFLLYCLPLLFKGLTEEWFMLLLLF
jgi:hypothetical protein